MFAAPNEMAVLERMTSDNKLREQWLENVQYLIPEDDFHVMVCAMEWPKRVRTIIQVHQKRIQEEYDHYEVALKKKRVEFATLLDKYSNLYFLMLTFYLVPIMKLYINQQAWL